MDREQLKETMETVVFRLLNFGNADYESDKSTSKEDTAKGLVARDFGIEEWDWPQGIGLYGLCKLQAYEHSSRYQEFLENWFARNLKIGLPSKNINTTAPYLAMLDLGIKTGNQEYLDRCLEQAVWLMESLPKTEENGFQHLTSAIGNRDGVDLHEGQLWADTLFMAVLFLNRVGQYFHRPEFVEESIHQFLLHIKYLYDKKDGLFYHGWTFLERNNFGGIFWCRGNSWFTYGVADYIDSFDQIPLDAGVRRFLIDTYKAQVGALAGLQAENGLWHTVLKDPDSYCEVSGSAAIAAGILKGIRMGILDDSFRATAGKAVAGICQNIGTDGTVLNVSAGTGMGDNADHYKNILIRPMAYGQSLTILALAEALETLAEA